MRERNPLVAHLWPGSLGRQAVAIIVALFAVVSAESVLVISLGQRTADAYAKEDQAQHLQVRLLMLSQHVSDQQRWLHAYQATADASFLARYQQERAQVAPLEAAIRGNQTAETAHSIDGFFNSIGDWQQFADTQVAVIAARGPGKDPQADAVDTSLFTQVGQSGGAAYSASEALEEQQLAVARSRHDAQVIGVLIGLALILAMITLLGLKFLRSTLAPIRQLIDAAHRTAAGQHAELSGLDRLDEVGRLSRALATWRESTHQREIIASLMLEVSGRVETEGILELAGDRLAQLLAADQVVIALRDREGYRIALTAPADLRLSDVVLSRMTTSPSLNAGHPVLANTVPDDWDTGLRAWARANDLGPIMVAPLVSSGRLLGVAAILRRSGRAPFDDGDVQRSEIILPQIAAALHVSELFGEVHAANDALKLASRHKSEFLASMSHELRTPLNSILGFSQMLLDYPEMAVNGERRSRYLNNISSAGRHLLGLINDILDLSKVEAGRLELNVEAVPVREAVEGVLATVRPLAEAKDITLAFDIDQPITVDADRTRLVQVLLNLLSNAIKFTPEGGRVAITSSSSGTWARIEVADTGVGIAKEDQTKIFGEFEQLEAGRSKGREGTGLGLALTKTFVELQGGSIEVESEIGQGARFIVRLPLHDPRQQDQLAGEFDSNHGPHVLVVEDDPASARILAEYLARADYKVVWASTPADAIEQALEVQPAAITLDIQLPELEGWDVLHRLKRDPATAGIPVLVVSVLDDRPRALAGGAIGLLTKPIDMHAMLRLLEEAIAASRRATA